VTNVTGRTFYSVFVYSRWVLPVRKVKMGNKSQQFTDLKAVAYTPRVPSLLRELTRSVAMALGWLIASAIVVLTVGFVVSALF
jgi:hypothetical protein